VKSVEAASKRVDNDTDKQFVALTINGGQAVSLQYLKDNGYTVEFQSTTPNLFADAATGELDEAALKNDFEYKVVITKDDAAIESELAKVSVVDFASDNVTNVTPEITGVTFEEVKDIITEGQFTETVLKPENINLSSTEYKAEISEDGTIFADVDGQAGFTAGTDISLGSLSAVFSGTTDGIADLKATGGSMTGTAAAGAEGTIVLKATKVGETVPTATKTINVKVPN
jgi:hypothetical protein